eukprot:2615767-Pleurochrysis_carterae.AAC.1
MAVHKRVRSEIKTQLTLHSNRFSVRTQWRSRCKNVSDVLILAMIKDVEYRIEKYTAMSEL